VAGRSPAELMTLMVTLGDIRGLLTDEWIEASDGIDARIQGAGAKADRARSRRRRAAGE